MKLIAHRINTLDELQLLSTSTPIEFDIRDSAGHCIIQHDPFKNGILFEEFLPHLKNRFLIVNIKSEGIEYKVLELLKQYKIENFFLLDCSIPMMYKLTQQGETRLAIRYSEMESLDTVLKWSNKVQWIWVDCFTKYPLTSEISNHLHTKGFKLCLVSPELQGRPEELLLTPFIEYAKSLNADAICTKYHNFSIWS
jgi:hypothetical protein